MFFPTGFFHLVYMFHPKSYDKVSSLAYISLSSKVFVLQNSDTLTKNSFEKLAI